LGPQYLDVDVKVVLYLEHEHQTWFFPPHGKYQHLALASPSLQPTSFIFLTTHLSNPSRSELHAVVKPNESYVRLLAH
jgi:hypothetical protein